MANRLIVRRARLSWTASIWLLSAAAAAVAAAAAPAARAAELVIGDFSQGLALWERRSFQGETSYRIVERDGITALEATADGSASALYRRLTIDLRQTPWLHWRWKVAATFGPDLDERAREGDDYPARIYVVRRGGLAFWRTRALNYVWASARPIGDRWPNAYAGRNVQMWALDSGEARVGQWVSHSRDLRADWRAAFGEDIVTLDGLALMTDADDTGGSARAWYADIHFSSSMDPPWAPAAR
jgi:hypothetical protein